MVLHLTNCMSRQMIVLCRVQNFFPAQITVILCSQVVLAVLVQAQIPRRIYLQRLAADQPRVPPNQSRLQRRTRLRLLRPPQPTPVLHLEPLRPRSLGSCHRPPRALLCPALPRPWRRLRCRGDRISIGSCAAGRRVQPCIFCTDWIACASTHSSGSTTPSDTSSTWDTQAQIVY
jgi:hypothetical protein